MVERGMRWKEERGVQVLSVKVVSLKLVLPALLPIIVIIGSRLFLQQLNFGIVFIVGLRFAFTVEENPRHSGE